MNPSHRRSCQYKKLSKHYPTNNLNILLIFPTTVWSLSLASLLIFSCLFIFALFSFCTMLLSSRWREGLCGASQWDAHAAVVSLPGAPHRQTRGEARKRVREQTTNTVRVSCSVSSMAGARHQYSQG